MADELDALLARVDDEALRRDLTAQIAKLRQKRQFGLVFEEHLPERVALPQHRIRRGTKVLRRDGSDEHPRVVLRVRSDEAVVAGADGDETVPVDDLVVVAEFGEPIYPGLKRLGSIDRGGDKPAHVVIKGENYHALEALQFTHAGTVDCIYIDPPYNTGARDWKYNNDYVDGDDAYRHSKWLAFMQRRLLLAKKLLNPDDSVLIVTIDEKEYLRLGLLVEQVFSGVRTQMISSVVNPASSSRSGEFGRSNEFLFIVYFGQASPAPLPLDPAWFGKASTKRKNKIRWQELSRRGDNGRRPARPNLFYPIFVQADGSQIHSIGEAIDLEADMGEVASPPGTVAVWPIRRDGSHGTWGRGAESLRDIAEKGFVKLGGFTQRGMAVYHLARGEQQKVIDGTYPVVGHATDGSVIVDDSSYTTALVPGTQWEIPSHDSSTHGSSLLAKFLPGRRFPFPKSLYAVEDVLRFFLHTKPNAAVLDFFAGSGTTAHAVARLNRQDGGQRRSIVVTNNEVSDDEAKRLAGDGHHPGDRQWEALGIFQHITRPRIEAAITGVTPEGEPVKGDYKFTDEFPMAEGFDENVEFVELAYLDAEAVELDKAFEAIAPLLWMRAGSVGPVLSESHDSAGRRKPYVMSEKYAVLFNPDRWRTFVAKLRDSLTHVFVVTDSASEFANVAAELPDGVEVVRLYENYLSTFTINTGATAP